MSTVTLHRRRSPAAPPFDRRSRDTKFLTSERPQLARILPVARSRKTAQKLHQLVAKTDGRLADSPQRARCLPALHRFRYAASKATTAAMADPAFIPSEVGPVTRDSLPESDSITGVSLQPSAPKPSAADCSTYRCGACRFAGRRRGCERRLNLNAALRKGRD